jgi:starch phosphorylase
MRATHVITARTVLPPELQALERVGRNLAWTWEPDAWALFARLDERLWERVTHNPIQLLRLVEQRRLNELAADAEFRAALQAVAERVLPPDPVTSPKIAYFSAEFGLAECLPIYAGGLGVLAGDHLKAASNRGLELAGVGLFYRQGYFNQVIADNRWQLEHYPDHEPALLPLEPLQDPRGNRLTLRLAYPGRDVMVRAWRAQVGRVPLYLLDTDFEPNDPADRELTRRLYGGDRDLRLRQEILLGIGGLRLLRLLRLAPDLFHLNEGHAAFLTIERLRELMTGQGMSFEQARCAAAPGLVFTTHTPVPAGNDAFPSGMLDYYFGDYHRELGISRGDFLGLGRQNPGDEGEPFSMTVLALKLCGASNAVSELHGQVARRMWHRIWPELPPEAAPIGAVTNGVHMPSWIAPELREADTLDDAELWTRHERLRARLVDFVRRRLAAQLQRRGAGPATVARTGRVLDPGVLTIGFARRFAGYKRATLLLGDQERLERLVNNRERPVQLVFAGKAHPADDPGKELIQQVVDLSQQPAFRNRVVFLEDYDLNMARHMVHGADVWLNTPRRPLEASGTSGMKAIANGVLHLGTLDGWWDEAFAEGLGWAIGERHDYADIGAHDAADRDSLFDLLEQEIVPLFYQRDPSGLPRRWLVMMRASMAALTPRFSTARMLEEYDVGLYQPGIELSRKLLADGGKAAQQLVEWLARLEAAWPGVRVEQLSAQPHHLQVGEPLTLEAVASVGGLDPRDVAVEVLLGPIDADGEIHAPRELQLEPAGKASDDHVLYRVADASLEHSGPHGLVTRLTPNHPCLLPLQRLAWARWGV